MKIRAWIKLDLLASMALSGAHGALITRERFCAIIKLCERGDLTLKCDEKLLSCLVARSMRQRNVSRNIFARFVDDFSYIFSEQ